MFGRDLKKYVNHEASMAKLLPKHPNICACQRVFETQDYVYIVMEFCGSTSVSQLHESVGATEEQAKNYLRQMIKAELAMKTVNIYNLDIKKENMMINDQGVLKIIDFGLISFDDLEYKEHSHDVRWSSMSYEWAHKRPYTPSSIISWRNAVAIY